MNTAPNVILNASKQPYLSIGKFYGGITMHGYEYKYIIMHDAFLRHDFIKKYNTHKKKGGDWNQFIETINN